MIWGNKHRIIQSLMIRVGVGKLKGSGVTSFFSTTELKLTSYYTTLGVLVGKRNSHLEFTLGTVYFDGEETTTSHLGPTVNTEDYQDFDLVISLGYRFQKPGGQFVFRTGAGWPELLYISLGFCFSSTSP